MMNDILNPSLYRKLVRLFGTVRVSCAGEAMMARATRGLLDEPRLTISHAGEYYQVNCPYCHDTKFRLFVNHMFGQRDGHGRRMTYLAVCYNEGCLSREANRDNFVERLGDSNWLASNEVRQGVEVSPDAREVSWPGPCKPLSDLPDRHRANAYLASRGFDPTDLATKFQVSYCTDSEYFLAANRVVIPVFEGGRLRGWQARYVGELPWKDPEKKQGLPPKYFSCPNSQFRSKCVYNFDSMREWETGVIVEGPTDVWRGGSMFGCIFGNTITQAQFSKLISVFRHRKLVLCLDPEEYNSRSTRRKVEEFTEKMATNRFCAVRLPKGTDPGSLDRKVLKEYIRQLAAKKGVKVTYRKV